jgi:7-cyano-7-deazaguanine synthase
MSKALVIFSGGQDSTTCLYWALENFDEVHAVTFNYGQRHAIETESASKIAYLARQKYPKRMKSHELLGIGQILRSSSPLVSSAKLEQYTDFNALPGGLEKTFVPGRNLLFITLAANIAHSKGIADVVTGVCQEDFGGYPDCREIFIRNAEQTIRAGFALEQADLFFGFKIHTPLMNLSKAQTVLLAHENPNCWDALAYSHTAYDGVYPPTGKDHANLLREKGFDEAGLPDPLIVRAITEGLMVAPLSEAYAQFRIGAL